MGIRNFDKEVTELKRMYVKNAYRGYKIGVSLLQYAINLAKELEYKKIRFDTLESMKKAQELYYSFGFVQIPPNRFNPLVGTIYMEKDSWVDA